MHCDNECVTTSVAGSGEPRAEPRGALEGDCSAGGSPWRPVAPWLPPRAAALGQRAFPAVPSPWWRLPARSAEHLATFYCPSCLRCSGAGGAEVCGLLCGAAPLCQGLWALHCQHPLCGAGGAVGGQGGLPRLCAWRGPPTCSPCFSRTALAGLQGGLCPLLSRRPGLTRVCGCRLACCMPTCPWHLDQPGPPDQRLPPCPCLQPSCAAAA